MQQLRNIHQEFQTPHNPSHIYPPSSNSDSHQIPAMINESNFQDNYQGGNGPKINQRLDTNNIQEQNMYFLYQTPQQMQQRMKTEIRSGGGPANFGVETSMGGYNSEFHQTANTTYGLLPADNQNKACNQSIIDWVNSFNDPYCLLVNSLQDFRDGISLCHLVGFVTCSAGDQAKMRQLIYYNCEQDSQNLIHSNIELSLNVLKSSSFPLSDQVHALTTQDILTSDDSLILLLLTLQQTYDIMNANGQQDDFGKGLGQQKTEKDSFYQEYSASMHSVADNSLQIPLNFNQQPKFSSVPKQQLNYNIPKIPINKINTIMFDDNTEQSQRHQSSDDFLKNQKITPRNLPLQMSSQQQPPFKQNAQTEKNSYYNTLEHSNISPINVKQINYNDFCLQSQNKYQQEQLLNQQEDQLYQELNQINISSMKAKATPTNKQHNQSNIHNTSSMQQPSRLSSASKALDKHQLQQKQYEKTNYSKVIQKSYEKMVNSKLRDPAIFDKSPQMPLKIHDQSLNKDITHIISNNKENTFIDTSIRDKKQDVSRSGLVKDKTIDREEEQIMNEMQTLTIKPEDKESKKQKDDLLEIKVDKVDLKIKHKVLEWLAGEVKLIKNKSDKLIFEFPQYCRNGVLFFDLMNRLNGKHAIIKGVDRNPKNATGILHNFNKILEYLRQFQRCCPRYLWAQQLLTDGNEDVIWGLLDDIWYWHHNKISPFDPTNKIQQNLKLSLSPKKEQNNVTLSPIAIAQKQIDQSHNTISYDQPSKYGIMLPPKSNKGITQDNKNSQSSQNLITLQLQHVNQHSIDTGTPLTVRQSVTLSNINTITRDKSYSSIHRSTIAMKSPQKSCYAYMDQQTTQIRSSRKRDQQCVSQLNVRGSHKNNNSYCKSNRSFSNSRRRDINYANTPIAKDSNGTFYFMNSSKEQEERDCISLLANNPKHNFSQNNNNSVHSQTFITDAMEGEVNEWLFKIKFHSFLSKEFIHQDIVNDPIRNGLFLSELVCYLERIDMFNIIQEPRSIQECKENINKVISVIRQRRREMPPRLFGDQTVESIMKRDKQILYSILYHLKQSYPDIQPITQQMNVNGSQDIAQNLALPYSQGELRMLEMSLLNWIKSLGIFSKLGKVQSEQQFDTLMQIQKEISNGTLLCELVQTLFNTKLQGGFFKDPKTDSTCVSNIRKALEFLRKQGKMSQKFTWAEKEIFEGKIFVAMGILEDLHRCFDGVIPRKRGPNYFNDGPYLGDTLYNEQPYIKSRIQNRNAPYQLDSKENSKKSVDKEEKEISTIDQTIELNALNKLNKFEEIPSIFSQRNNDENSTGNQIKQALSCFSPQSTYFNSNSNSNNTNNQNQNPGKANFGNFLNAKLQREQEKCRSPLKPASIQIQKHEKPHLYISNENKENQQENHRTHNFPTLFSKESKLSDLLLCQPSTTTNHSISPSSRFMPPTRSPLSMESRGKQIEFDGKGHIRKPSQTISIENYEDEEHSSNRNAFNLKEKSKIVEWLQFLNIKGIASNFTLNKPNIDEFKDGVLICEIVGTLEGHQIENIQARPKSTASCLLNIKKALQVLKKKNQIPLYLIYSEEEIHNGNSDIIFQLLKSLRQVYRTKTLSMEQMASQQVQKRNTDAMLMMSRESFGNRKK